MSENNSVETVNNVTEEQLDQEAAENKTTETTETPKPAKKRVATTYRPKKTVRKPHPTEPGVTDVWEVKEGEETTETTNKKEDEAMPPTTTTTTKPAKAKAKAKPKETAKPAAGQTKPKTKEQTDGLRKPQVRILEALAKATDGLTRGEIAKNAGIDPAMGHYLGHSDPKNYEAWSKKYGFPSLLFLGHVKASEDDRDGKIVQVHKITASGKKALEKASK